MTRACIGTLALALACGGSGPAADGGPGGGGDGRGGDGGGGGGGDGGGGPDGGASVGGAADHDVVVGAGFSDVSPHQLVRTRAGTLYVVVPTCDSYPSCPDNALRVYKGAPIATPTSFAELDAAHAPTGGIGSSAIAIDGDDRIAVVWNDRSPAVRYAVFDTASDTWGAASTIEATAWSDFGQGDEGVALAIDGSGVAHAAWTAQLGGTLRARYAARAGAGWTTPITIDDVALTGNRRVWHPTLAFAPGGALVLAWLDGTFNYTADGVIRVRARSPAGVWAASVTIADQALTAIDNGPSLIITADGVRHLAFGNYDNQVRYWYDAGAGWQGDAQPPTQQTHDPALGPDGAGGVFIYGHGTPVGSIGGHGDDLFRFHRPLGGAWSAFAPYATGGYDSSVSTRWSQFFHHFPATLDVAYWADPYPNVLHVGKD